MVVPSGGLGLVSAEKGFTADQTGHDRAFHAIRGLEREGNHCEKEDQLKIIRDIYLVWMKSMIGTKGRRLSSKSIDQ